MVSISSCVHKLSIILSDKRPVIAECEWCGAKFEAAQIFEELERNKEVFDYGRKSQ